MTKLRTCGLIAFLPTQRQKERLRLTAAICVVLLLCAATSIASPAQILTTLHSFAGYPTDGYLPNGLVQGSDGNFYGTTLWGGASGDCSDPAGGCGTVFKLTPGGTLTIVYSLCSQPNCADGAEPEGALLQATDGNFYGTTYAGGVSHDCSGAYVSGCGTIFKITPAGTLTTLYRFCPQTGCADGEGPDAGVVQATDGNLYGTTEWGGAYGDGTVFKVTPAGTLTTLHAFNDYDGYSPGGGLVQATDGNFYGTTVGGGAKGSGTVFRITPSGTLTTLHSFCSQTNCTDGYFPNGVVQASDGNLYGTTEYGGTNNDCNGVRCGTVFKITQGGTLTTLHSFDGTDGFNPVWLVQASDGNFYGTTSAGGANNLGTVFEITPAGALTTLYSFCSQQNCPDGAYPGGLMQARDGNFYGTTTGFYTSGGARNDGTVFRLVSVRPCLSCPLEWK